MSRFSQEGWRRNITGFSLLPLSYDFCKEIKKVIAMPVKHRTSSLLEPRIYWEIPLLSLSSEEKYRVKAESTDSGVPALPHLHAG